MTTETILTDDQIESLAGINDHNSFTLRAHNDMKLARTTEQAVLQSPEVQALRKDAERYLHIRGGNQWVIAATRTGFHMDGEHLDELIDAEMEQQK